MKKITYILFLVIGLTLTSCLKYNLEELPAYSDAEMLGFDFEYRWESDGKLAVFTLTTATTIDSNNGTITCSVTVPSASGSLTDSERANISLSNIVGYTTISTAAIIAPVNNSPTLGTIADWSSKSYEYKVTAANGDSKTWKVIIDDFTK